MALVDAGAGAGRHIFDQGRRYMDIFNEDGSIKSTEEQMVAAILQTYAMEAEW